MTNKTVVDYNQDMDGDNDPHVITLEQQKTARKQVRRRPLVILAAVIVILVFGAVATGVYVHRRELSQKNEQLAEQLMQDALRYEATQKKTKELIGKKLWEQAETVAFSYINTGIDNDKKAFLLVDVGTIHESKGENKQALETYRKAEQLATQEVTGITRGIARTSFKMGDNETALEYYKKTLALLEGANAPGNRMSIEAVRRVIDGIEAKQ